MKYVILGVGAAGITAAKEIRELSEDAEIVMVSLDEQVHSRCMLHKYIAGEREEKGLDFAGEDFFERYDICWIKGRKAEAVDTKTKLISLDTKETISYDKLLIATGANSFIPPVGEFRKASNVFGLRHLADAKAICEEAKESQHVLIVGSGLVGLDAAYGLLELGKKITVVEMVERILPIQLDEHAANAYQALFEEAGVQFILGRKADKAECNADGKIKKVVLDNGEEIDCDMIIVAAGVRPAVGFLNESGITVDRGIVVDEYLKTSEPDVYAAGDVAGLSGIWPNAMKQGKIAARNMCGQAETYKDRYAFKNTINFFGLASLCIGMVQTEEEDVIEMKEDKKVYKKAVFKDHKLKSMLLQGDISHAGIWQHIIKNEVDISKVNKSVFQLSFADFYQVGERGTYEW